MSGRSGRIAMAAAPEPNLRLLEREENSPNTCEASRSALAPHRASRSARVRRDNRRDNGINFSFLRHRRRSRR
jgi:hypothetical protein